MDKTYYDNQLKRNRDRSDKEQPASSNNEDAKASSFVQQGREMTCCCCGKKGHLSPDCEKKDAIPRKQEARSIKHSQQIIGVCQWLIVVSGHFDLCYAIPSPSPFCDNIQIEDML
jgi:hypothetical protein